MDADNLFPNMTENPKEASDRSLLRWCSQEENAAQEEVYRRYQPAVYRLVMRQLTQWHSRADAEVIASSILRTFFRQSAAGNFWLDEGEELLSLFCALARRKVWDAVQVERRQKRDETRVCPLSDLMANGFDPHDPGAKTPLEALIVMEEINGFREDLTPHQERIFDLMLEGRGPVEMARLTEFPVTAVKGLVFRIRQRLEKLEEGESG